MCEPDSVREFVLFDQIEQMTTKELNAVLEKQHSRIAELEEQIAEYERLHKELADGLDHDAKAPSLCDLVAISLGEYRNKKKLVEALGNRYELGDIIRKSFLKHGHHSWCSIADDVITAIVQVKEKPDEA